jgi:NADPH2:quinone reductase
MWTELREPVERGELQLPIDRTFRLDEVAAALAHMRANAHFGKILLVP